MRRLPEIEALYKEIDADLESQRTAASTACDSSAVRRVEVKQVINDQAYFVLCWGQLESAIDDACRNAIRNRIRSSSWADRRAWDVYNPDDDRLSGLRFENRVALVLDRRAGPGSSWARIMHFYSPRSPRNQIAHGDLRTDRINIPGVVREFFVIQGAMQP